MSWIQNEQIEKFAEALILRAPEYFWHVSSSSTNKYHPPYALGEGGLCRHSKAAAAIAHELLGLEMYGKYNQDERDMIITCLIAHDFFKHGLENDAGKYTVAEHPLVCANYIKNSTDLCSMLSEDKIEFICSGIASHMGEYNTDYRSKKEILPKPKTPAQKMIHQCDLLASRRWILIDFGDDYYNPEKDEPEPSEPPVDELAPVLTEIVELCKTKIADGVDRNLVYKVIKENNNGNRNPNSISDVAVARDVKKKLEGLSVA